jgi:F-type H+-transporting ATPase subunit delta
VDISSGIQASLAGRYALALFGLARDQKQLESVGASLAKVRQALTESDDFRTLTTSPLIDRKERQGEGGDRGRRRDGPRSR